MGVTIGENEAAAKGSTESIASLHERIWRTEIFERRIAVGVGAGAHHKITQLLADNRPSGRISPHHVGVGHLA